MAGSEKQELSPSMPQLFRIAADGRCYDFIVSSIGADQGAALDVAPDCCSECYMIILCCEGSGILESNGSRYSVRPGTLLLLSPGTSCSPRSNMHSPIRCAHLEFKLTDKGDSIQVPFHQLLSMYFGASTIQPLLRMDLNDRQTKTLLEMIRQLANYLSVDARSTDYPASRKLLDILLFLVEEVYELSVVVSQPNDTSLIKVKEEIENRFDASLSLNEIARSASLSVGHLCRTFKAKFHVSPMAYQREVRIKVAKNLLKSTQLSCKEIAVRTGFCDAYRFSKLFKKIVGATPTKYRESSRSIIDKQ